MTVADDYGLVLRSTLEDTANAIREVLGTNDEFYPPQFGDKIREFWSKTRLLKIKSELKPLIPRFDLGSKALNHDSINVQVKQIIQPTIPQYSITTTIDRS